MIPSAISLENGSSFPGFSPLWQTKVYYGEVVFNTGMTGYPESLTDPSYAGQILTFSYPLPGNYGVPAKEKWESDKIQVNGVVVSDPCIHESHYQSIKSLLTWLEEQEIPIIRGVDTRSLTKLLRCHGTMRGAIVCGHPDPLCFDLHPGESGLKKKFMSKPLLFGAGSKRVIAVDCGMKKSILKNLLNFPLEVKRVPYNYDYTDEVFDGIVLSNGPGDPMNCQETTAILKKAMLHNKPIFGICLGAQLLALAEGGKTYKLPFGHRGHNQPCIDLETKRCFITSQNHGYAIDKASLPDEWRVSWTNLNDGSVEGISHQTKPFFGVQFHPEASPGPTDTIDLFKRFYEML